MTLKRDYPPHYFVLALGLMYALKRWWPLHQWGGAELRPAGILLAGAGFLALLGLLFVFRRHRTTVLPFQPATALITSGPFRVSRNPIYLVLGMILLGGALWLGNLSALLVPPLFAGIITFRFIRPEERHLAERFGDTYRAYCQRVPRWL